MAVLGSRSLWSEDIASFALTLSGALCDQGVNATVVQFILVIAFFLFNTTTGGTVSDGTTTTSATAAGDSPTITTIYVSGVAELTLELRPADERVSATMFVCSAVDSDITESSEQELLFFLNFYIWDAGNTPLLGLALPWARPQSSPQRVPIVYIGGAASWRPCNVAPHS